MNKNSTIDIEMEVKPGSTSSRRAAALADRIEQGAAELAAFAATLSEDEWRAPMPGGGNDKRPVGIIVHHVASAYPIEIELARTIARRHAAPDITSEDVDELNARHARNVANAGKTTTLDLLYRNSRDAAAAVRAFSDEELDRAAPFSLSDGALVTVQFVIEDHAVRHSWHHLARIRRTLGR